MINRKEYMSLFYEKNREELKKANKEYQKLYYKDNKEKFKTYYKNNKEDILKKQKERYQRKEKTMSIRRLNGHAYIHYKAAICEGLNIDNADLYKAIISIDNNGVIETKDNKKYILIINEIK